MKVIRTQEIPVYRVCDYRVGDRIRVGNYTATCQKVTGNAAVFLLDQSLEKKLPMNFNSNNKGGYNASYLRQKLIELADESPFFNIRKVLVPFENSDLLRIPTVGEVFGDADTNIYDICVMDGAKQWELMSERINRMEIGWLQNKVGRSGFACTDRYGLVNLNVRAGVPNIVRPVFQVAA